MKLRYTPQAILDLDEISRYISEELQNPAAAERILRSIAADAAALKDMPSLGVELRQKTGRDIPGRALVSGRYLLIYEVTDAVSVLRVLDTRVDYLRVLSAWEERP